jgi:hypothetical protein
MKGIKHLIECHCFLKVFDKSENKINHKFPVYSKLDENNNILPKLAKCNNCESLHYVYDACRSELRPGKEDLSTILTIEDIMMMLPDRINSVLTANRSDIADFEHALDIIENERWGETIVVKRSIVGEIENIKILQIDGENKIKILNKEINTILVGNNV